MMLDGSHRRTEKNIGVNGRHARIAADALLRQMEATPIDWVNGVDLQQAGQQRSAYIQALRAASSALS